MNERVVWTGDRNPITEGSLSGLDKVWLNFGDYTAFARGGVCFVAWGEKPVLSISAEERGGNWDLVMRQNPKMAPFPDKVMETYQKALRPVIQHLTREPPEDTPHPS